MTPFAMVKYVKDIKHNYAKDMPNFGVILGLIIL